MWTSLNHTTNHTVDQCKHCALLAMFDVHVQIVSERDSIVSDARLQYKTTRWRRVASSRSNEPICDV